LNKIGTIKSKLTERILFWHNISWKNN